MFDLIIIGSGPAGLSAAVYAKRAGLNMLIIEKNPVSGGQIIDTYEVDNYLGIPGVNGFDLAMKFREHADKLGAEFADGIVTGIEKLQGENGKTVFKVNTENASYETRTVVIAAGAHHSKLGIPGEEEYIGKGVSYCATCDGAFYKGKVAAVNGGGDVAVEDAIFLARFCEKVYLIHRRDELRAAKILQDELFGLPNVEVIWDSVVQEIKGEDKVTTLRVKNLKENTDSDLNVDGIFVAIGIHPTTESFANIVECDENGYIIAGEDCATNVPGIFAAGDCRKKRLRQIVTSVADGANAVTAAQDYLIL
ncbi:MAG: thioredoxin-disulfide reductase [Butyrivibrio sp.]|jgi:thioredoxin reductase (NADPH)|uniref:Thioredoxin reductase n=1 Tax=Butyrivibrio hungatei TaxID=185008 RepID=A0A1G5FQD2_9FIRM|nr:thioredoxin-disulfide reductase [Butyrivibrio hungatei]MBQ4221084.1 thioredoxin-disulfide reductase [Butyrivibrio sp.]MBR4357871.1 thioredoxin-disulfide reductase [Butyrivibrio sp.]MBR4639746.1 thioredoxin-disulfide reductase [Butyrivibrio sp.]MCR4996648.1 thioredoxin-disulfide reductase [Butyrivibrio sp.]SCY41443.1 thioredoxin reductase (NADPH) [Butyrivibrio hungatei]